MIDVSHPVRHPYNLTFKRIRPFAPCMVQNAVKHLICKVKTLAVLFELFAYPYTLLKMRKSVFVKGIKRPLAGMSERGMPKVVTQRNRLGQILI